MPKARFGPLIRLSGTFRPAEKGDGTATSQSAHLLLLREGGAERRMGYAEER